MSRRHLIARRDYGLELTEIKAIDAYEYSKSRYRLYEGRTLEDVEKVIAWLEMQDDWDDAEWKAPDWAKREMREQNMIAREAREYEKSIADTGTGSTNTRSGKARKGNERHNNRQGNAVGVEVQNA